MAVVGKSHTQNGNDTIKSCQYFIELLHFSVGPLHKCHLSLIAFKYNLFAL